MDGTDHKPRTALWIKILLAVSLALNLMVIGLIAGVMVRGGPLGAKGPGMGYAAPYVIALPREDRRAVFGAVRRSPDFRDRQARRADFQDMLRLLRAHPFDAEAARTILSRQAASVADVQATAQAAWLQVVIEMEPDARSAYADAIEEVLRKGRR